MVPVTELKFFGKIRFLLRKTCSFILYNNIEQLGYSQWVKAKKRNFREFPKFEIVAKWARNNQIKRFKKEKLEFFNVFYLAHISFYSDLPFKKFVILRFQITYYSNSSGFSKIKNPRPDSESASKTTLHMSFSETIYDKKGANHFRGTNPVVLKR